MKVSIIVPTYNAEKYLQKCIDTLTSQTIDDYEIILVDDGSTDTSAEICKNACKNNNRIIFIQQSNGGSTSARNTGIYIAKGKYIGLVDSDDWIDEDMFKTMYEACEDNMADMCVVSHIKEDGVPKIVTNNVKSGIYNEGELDKYIFSNFIAYYCDGRRGVSPALWCKLFRREILINNLQYIDSRIVMGEDLLLSSACMLDCKTIVIMNEFTPYHYRISTEQLSSRYRKDYFNKSIILFEKMLEINKKKDRYNIQRQNLMNLFYFSWDAIINEWRLGANKSIVDRYKLIDEICNNRYVKLACEEIELRRESIRQRIKIFLMKWKLKPLIYLLCRYTAKKVVDRKL